VAETKGREGLLVDFGTGVLRRDRVLILCSPIAVLFMGYGSRAERLGQFACDDEGDPDPFIARCREIAEAVESGSLVKAQRSGVPRAILEIEDRALRRLAIAEALVKYGYDPDQPRVPAGSGRGSGEWATANGNASPNAANEQASAASGNGPSPTVPDYKKNSIGQGDWATFLGALNASGLSPDRQYVYSEIFAAEGGFAVNPQDGTVAGITQATLDAAKAATDANGNPRYPDLAGVATPGDLTPQQIVAVYSAYFDQVLHTVGGAAALDAIGDPQTAAAFADTLFRHGPTGGTEIIQQAIRDVSGGMTEAEQQGLGLGSANGEPDGRMGPQTLGAVEALVQGGYADQLRNAIAHGRLGSPYGNEKARINHFR
jgi:lysozyme family protein